MLVAQCFSLERTSIMSFNRGLRLTSMTAQADVDEALRLMRMSKVSLLESGPQRKQKDPVSLIYEAIRDDAQRSCKQSYTWGDLNLLIGNKFSVSHC